MTVIRSIYQFNISTCMVAMDIWPIAGRLKHFSVKNSVGKQKVRTAYTCKENIDVISYTKHFMSFLKKVCSIK